MLGPGMRDGRRAARNSALNLAGVVIPAALAIIATPVILNNLGPQGFGIFSLQLAVLVLIGVNDFGISRAMTLEAVAQGGFTSNAELRQVVWAGIHLITVVAVGVIVIGGSAMTIVTATTPMSMDQQISWALLIPAAAVSLVTLPARAALEVQERFALSNSLRTVGSSLLFAGPALATYIEPTMTATSLAMLGSRVGLSIASIVATRNLLERPDWKQFTHVLRGFVSLRASKLHWRLIRRAGWLGSAGITSMLIGYVDRFALGFLATATVIALYVVPAELVTKMWLVTGALTSAVMPRLAHYWRDDGGGQFGRLFNLLLYSQLALVLSAHVIFVFFGEHLLAIWLGSQYDQSMSELLAILSIGISVNTISSLNYIVLILHGKERLIAHVQFVALLLTVIASLIAGYYYQAAGVAWVFSGRLVVDAFVIRALVPSSGGKIRSGVHPSIMLIWLATVLGLYVVAQVSSL
ncbi:MAG: hypothetical protein CL945_04535 [Dinoroseobacter sp.]|nr:hypothetical protein [Dinoroseobacter sp.]